VTVEQRAVIATIILHCNLTSLSPAITAQFVAFYNCLR